MRFLGKMADGFTDTATNQISYGKKKQCKTDTNEPFTLHKKSV